VGSVGELVDRLARAGRHPGEARRAARLGWRGRRSGGTGPDPARPPAGDLRDGPSGPGPSNAPFRPVYRTEDEWALELANETVHAVLHLGWVEDDGGGHRGQMAVLVKPNGLLGRAYMVAIAPFRHLVVYPAALRDIGRDWQRVAA
jgi:hypothetical protein